jgi:ribosome-associated heat shock protein Hsp15
MEDTMRIDKYLWCVRVYKTRSMSTDACKNGRVELNEKSVKASQKVKEGDSISVRRGSLKMQFKVKAILKNRVGAKLVEQYLEDLTPQEDYDKEFLAKKKASEYRDRGLGRPTKKERREIDDFKTNV